MVKSIAGVLAAILGLLALSACQSSPKREIPALLCAEREMQPVCEAYKSRKVNTLLLELVADRDDDGPQVSAKRVIDKHGGELLLWLPVSHTLVVKVNREALIELAQLSVVETISLDTERELY